MHQFVGWLAVGVTACACTEHGRSVSGVDASSTTVSTRRQSDASVTVLDASNDERSPRAIDATTTPGAAPTTQYADVVGVETSADGDSFTFSVTVESPDTGCDQYANWWEVLSADGDLLYRRILAHSHVTEQPFTRSGGPLEIEAGTPVWVRAHMHPTGYGGTAFFGSVSAGFESSATSFDDESLAQTEPLPTNCAF